MINISIVLYNTSQEDINQLIRSFGNVELEFKLYIIDNSPDNSLKQYFMEIGYVVYIHNPANPGFGASHNIAFNESILQGKLYHFVVNPDVSFNEDVISKMIKFMSTDSSIGMVMPQIVNTDGSIQYLPKLLPSPLGIILRRLGKPKAYYRNFIDKYELRFVDPLKIYEAPVLSGCFTLFNVEALKDIGGYDDSFFMYFEDWDLSRRMHEKYKTVYFPHTFVYHGYESGANKSALLFKVFLTSAFRYFNKWGWFYDKRRSEINNNTLNQFNEKV